MGRVGVAEASTTHPRISIARKANIEALKLQLLVCHSAQRAFSAKESAQLPPDVRRPGTITILIQAAPLVLAHVQPANLLVLFCAKRRMSVAKPPTLDTRLACKMLRRRHHDELVVELLHETGANHRWVALVACHVRPPRH